MLDKNEHTKRAEELKQFDRVEVVHSLPPSYHYWSSNYLRPKFRTLGFDGLSDFNSKTILGAYHRKRQRIFSFASIGSGNCDIEIALAGQLRQAGATDFLFRCFDLNPAMLERGRAAANKAGLESQFSFEAGDLSNIEFDADSVDVFFANQSLHHIVELEVLFERIFNGLSESGALLICDMIGRNGHMMWPEALFYVDLLWSSLPIDKKFHHVLKATHENFPNTDFSNVGYEGVRAQDILPLLISFFSADVFLGVSNIARPFTSRGYGANFDVQNNDSDRAFIDFVARMDDELIDRGIVKPTLAIASFVRRRTRRQVCFKHRTAEFCVRWPG